MNIKAIKGTKDILPSDSPSWVWIETVARDLFGRYGFGEIRTPIFEATELFLRGIGEGTDIVQKEMYTFADARKRSITLRPEGTAPVVRAYLENHLPQQSNLHKLFYIGPMFRYERPQAGRMRQFHQIGVEAFGAEGAALDADVMVLLIRFLEALRIQGTRLKVNTLGSPEDKENYQIQLKEYLQQHKENLCGDCQRRFEKNVLRVLDCKNTSCQNLLQKAPRLDQVLSQEAKDHFEQVCSYLDQSGVDYVKDVYLVRGLDYYTGPVFEVTCASLGAQDTIAAGGRYDGLVRTMGGQATPAVGFACGVERLLIALPKDSLPSEERKGVYWACLGEASLQTAFAHMQVMRQEGFKAEMSYESKSLKSQMRYADKNQFKWLFILGDDELAKEEVQVKNLDDGAETKVVFKNLASWIKQYQSK